MRCEYLSADQLIAAVERGQGSSGSRSDGMWTILTFHGVDEGHLPVTGDDFGALLDHLARRNDEHELWVAPLIQVAQSIAAIRAGTRG